MIIRIKRKTLEQAGIGMLVLFVIVFVLIGVSFTTDYAVGATNVTNNTVLVRVNVTNTEPNITSVVVDDEVSVPASEIDLTANGATVVSCNASIFDYNGANDIDSSSVNATLHIQSVGRDGATDNNSRYRNESCGRCVQVSATNITCDCRFAVQYYANDSSTWLCNISIRDSGGTGAPGTRLNFSDSDVSGIVTITKLLALNTSTLLDYGNLSVTQTSAQITHNVTNVGNINLNLSLRGYGGTNETIGQNVTMICDQGNISFDNQRYALGTNNDGIAFADMRNLSNQTAVTNLTFYSRVDDSAFGWDRNSTFWRLSIPLGIGGLCNGTIIFGAIDAEV